MTEFLANTLAFGDYAGLGLWEMEHFRAHLDWNDHLAKSTSVASLSLTSGGSGYSSIPAIAITGGSGSGATAVVTGAAGGVITSIGLTAGGSGYRPDDTLSVVFSGGAPATPAAATASPGPSIQIGVYPIMNLTGAGDDQIKQWLQQHEAWHEQIRPYANVSGVNLAEVNFKNPSDFYQWIDVHSSEHQLIDQVFGLA